jgi:hypothetical protein
MSTGSVQTPQSDGRELDPSEIHDVLRNDRRRLVIEQLRDGDGREAVRDLAEYIGGVESGEDPPPRNVRQSVYVSLHQTHLPKLDKLGIVTYDADAKEVELASRASEVAVYLEVVPKYGLSWSEYYLGVGILGLLTLVGWSVGVPVLAEVGVTLLAGGLFGLIAASAAFQIVQQQSSLVHRLQD